MRASRWLSLTAGGLIALAVTAGPVSALDVLHLKEGDPVSCRILDITDRIVRVRVTIKIPGGGEAYGEKVVPMGSVALIDFGPLPGETLLLESATVEDLGEVEVLWDATRANLKRPNSGAGEIGLLYGSLLLASGAPGSAEHARDVFTKIESEDWNERRRSRARQGRLRTLLALGNVDAAVAEATVIANETEDPGILMDAKHVLAMADFDKLKELVEENPRWEEDDEIRPQRNALFHGIIDQFLYPYLFHGSDEDAAARGLWSAAEVFLSAGDIEQARRRAGDIVALYPKNSHAARARAFLEKEMEAEGEADSR